VRGTCEVRACATTLCSLMRHNGGSGLRRSRVLRSESMRLLHGGSRHCHGLAHDQDKDTNRVRWLPLTIRMKDKG